MLLASRGGGLIKSLGAVVNGALMESEAARAGPPPRLRPRQPGSSCSPAAECGCPRRACTARLHTKHLHGHVVHA